MRTSISSQSGVCRTLTRLLSISGFIARFTSSEIWLSVFCSVLPTLVFASALVAVCRSLPSWCSVAAPSWPGSGRLRGGMGTSIFAIGEAVGARDWSGSGTCAAGVESRMGSITLPVPLKASLMDCAITRNLVSFTADTAYITTNSASSKVIRSP